MTSPIRWFARHGSKAHAFANGQPICGSPALTEDWAESDAPRCPHCLTHAEGRAAAAKRAEAHAQAAESLQANAARWADNPSTASRNLRRINLSGAAAAWRSAATEWIRAGDEEQAKRCADRAQECRAVLETEAKGRG